MQLRSSAGSVNPATARLAEREPYAALMGLLKQHAGIRGSCVEYAYTMVDKAQQSAMVPHGDLAQHAGSVPKPSRYNLSGSLRRKCCIAPDAVPAITDAPLPSIHQP